MTAAHLFGLQTGGRIESILVSLPRTWPDGHIVLNGMKILPRKNFTDYYLKPQDWFNLQVESQLATVNPPNSALSLD